MFRPILIDINPGELIYYPFVISLSKCSEGCNVLSPKICIPTETKDIYVKAFNMITNKNEAKTMTEHISCDCANAIVQHVIQNKNGISQFECKNYNYEKYYSWNPSTCICENSKHIKSVVNTSVTECNKIVIVMNNLST